MDEAEGTSAMSSSDMLDFKDFNSSASLMPQQQQYLFNSSGGNFNPNVSTAGGGMPISSPASSPFWPPPSSTTMNSSTVNSGGILPGDIPSTSTANFNGMPSQNFPYNNNFSDENGGNNAMYQQQQQQPNFNSGVNNNVNQMLAMQQQRMKQQPNLMPQQQSNQMSMQPYGAGNAQQPFMDPQQAAFQQQQQQYMIQQQQRNFMMNQTFNGSAVSNNGAMNGVLNSSNFSASSNHSQLDHQQLQNGNNGGAMAVSSPSVTSSVDFCSPNSAGPAASIANPAACSSANSMMAGMQQSFGVGSPSSNHGNSATPNGLSSPTKNGMLTQMMSNNGMNGGMMSSQQQMFMEQQRMMSEYAAANGGQMPTGAMLMRQQQQMLAAQSATAQQQQQPRAFVFSTEMINRAAYDVSQKKFESMASWHMQCVGRSTQHFSMLAASSGMDIPPMVAVNQMVLGNANQASGGGMLNAAMASPPNSLFLPTSTTASITEQRGTPTATGGSGAGGRGLKRKVSTQQQQVDGNFGSSGPSTGGVAQGSPHMAQGSGATSSEQHQQSQQQLHDAFDVKPVVNASSASDFLRPPSTASSNKSGSDFRTDECNPLKRIEMMTNNHLESSAVSKITRMTDGGGGSSPFHHPSTSTPVSGSCSANFNKSADAKSKERKLAHLEHIEKSLDSGTLISHHLRPPPYGMPLNAAGEIMSMGGAPFPSLAHHQHMLGAMPPGVGGGGPPFDPQMAAAMMRSQQQNAQFYGGGGPPMPPSGMMPSFGGAGGGPLMMGGGNGGPLTPQQQMLMMGGGGGNTLGVGGKPPPFLQQPSTSLASFTGGGPPGDGTPPAVSIAQQQRLLQHHQMMMAQQQQGGGGGMPPTSAAESASMFATAQQQHQQNMMMAMDGGGGQSGSGSGGDPSGMLPGDSNGTGMLMNVWPNQHQMPQSLANLDTRVPVQKMNYFPTKPPLQPTNSAPPPSAP